MSVRTVLEMFDERVAASGDAVGLRARIDGDWTSITWNEWYARVDRFARGLIGLGVEVGDRVLLLSRNRPEWVEADLAIMAVGGVTVPIYPNMLAQHCAWSVRHAGCHWAVVEDPYQLEKLLQHREELPELRGIIVLDELATLDKPDRYGRVTISLRDLEGYDPADPFVIDPGRLGEVSAEVAREDANAGQRRRRDIALDDLATIVYTSGTTGTPRGVMLTHGNLAAEVLGNALAMPISADDRQILLLPLSQVFARALYLTAIHIGCVTSFSRGFKYITREFAEERPTFFVGVPTVFERLAGRFASHRSQSNIFNPERLRNLAVLAARRARAMQGLDELSFTDKLQLAVGDRTVFRQARRLFGGELRFAISGGAPLSPRVCEIYHGIGVPIYEGYGLTETSGAATTNRPDRWRTGTVGEPLRDVEIRIADDGEILIRGPVVSPGYWNDDEANRTTFREGWLHTGDVGAMVDGFLVISDRQDDVIVLSTGKKVSPARVESALQANSLVKRAVVCGEGQQRLVALLTLDEDALRAWSLANDLESLSHEELCVHERVYDTVRKAVDRMNAELRPSEQVHRFAILPRNFSPETGELTPTYKVRRRFVLEKYRGILEGLR